MTNLLDVLPEYVLSWIVQKGKERWLNEGEVLLREGEKSQALYIVLDGLFGVDSGVHDSPLSEHAAPGSVVGDISLFTDTPIHAQVVAQERSLVLEMNKQLLGEKLEHDHIYAADFYRAMLVSVAFRLHHARGEHAAHHADGGNTAGILKCAGLMWKLTVSRARC